MPQREWLDEPKHPILPEAWTHEVVTVAVQREPLDEQEPFIDLTVRRGADRVTLRFWSPRELHIDDGGAAMTGGFVILDVRGRGLEGVGVRVDDFEDVQGKVQFLARAVERRQAAS